jgi:hypothetical protein
VIIAAFVVEVEVVNPGLYEYYALNVHGFVLGFIAFLVGFLIIHAGEVFWQRIQGLRWLLLGLALGLYLLRWFYFAWEPPKSLVAVESNLWIFGLFAFGYRYLNQGSARLRYLSQAAYPVYILHMIYIYLASMFIFPLELAPEFKFVLVTLFTFVGCYGTYELIRRIKWLRPLFGLR